MNHSYPNIKQSFGLFFIYIVGSIGVGAMIFGIGSESSLSALISFLVINLSVIAFALRWKEVRFSYLISDNGEIPTSYFIVGCLSSLFLVTILDPIVSYLLPMPESMVEMFERAIQKNIWSFISVAIAAPFLEEFLFRRVMLTGLEKNYGAKKAILWSAFFFALFHMNPWQGIGAFLIGILLGWLYLNTRNIWLCIAIHAFNNSLAFAAFYFSDNVMFTIGDLTGYDYKLALIIGLSLVSLYFCYKYFDTAFRQNTSQIWNEDQDATEQAKPSDH